MTTLADLVTSYVRTPTATCLLDGRPWRGIQKLRYSQRFGENIAGGGADGREPPVTPRIGMSISWKWGYNGREVAGCTGEISDVTDFSYPDRFSLQVKDVLWRASKSRQVLQTDPLNDLTARAAIIYLLTHYGGISASKLQIPTLNASGSEWSGSEWVLGTQTPVAWGDLENNTGGTTAIEAAQEIASCLGYWIRATADGKVTATQMERKPSTTAREVFRRDVNLLLQGAPERRQSYESIYNQVTVLGANTGVLGSQIRDQFRTTHPLLPAGVYRDFSFSSFLIEYLNESEAGSASATKITQRILNVVSRIPDVIPLRAKADPNRKVGDTVGIIDSGVLIGAQRNFFIYALDRELDLAAGRFDDQITLDGGTGSTGYTTVPPPDASFSWRLMREVLDGTPVVEVFLDGSGSTSPTGQIVSRTWSTTTPTYGSTPDTATGETAVLIFEEADSPADITLEVQDTSSKIDEFAAAVDLTGADTAPPIQEVVSAAAGAAWLVTPDGGATWREETANGDAVAVGTIGAGADDRAPGTGGTYGLLATRGSDGGGGLRQTLDTLLTASTNLVSNSGAITSNIWVNEANPARVWFAIGTAVYRSLDGGATKTAMAAAPDVVTWIMEDAEVENSVFLLAGADMLNATDPTVGWALLYEGPIGATARQFVRSRDGQVTWICYTGAPAGDALQRVENGAAADFDATDVRSLALDRNASSLLATVYAVTGDDPAEIWSFNGLTGLSAFESTQTFPAGATVQHMLFSRQADVIYTADFDSVGAGQGALRKYFPQSDQLLLWKELASGQQGHMLGLGAAVASVASLILLPFGATGAADRLFFFDAATSVWLPIVPPVAGAYWHRLAANPFAPDSWLLLGNSFDGGGISTYQFPTIGGLFKMVDGTHSPLWRTDDRGATWTPIDLPSPIADGAANSARVLADVEWSSSSGTEWYACRLDIPTDKTATIWRGSGTTAGSPHTDLTTTQADSVISGLDGDVYISPTLSAPFVGRAAGYFDAANVFHVPSGTAAVDGQTPNMDRYPLTRSVLMVTSTGNMYGTSDYRASQPALITGTSGTSLAIVGENAYIGGRGGVLRVEDPFGAAATSVVFVSASQLVGRIRADQQTHTHGAVQVFGVGGVVAGIGVFDESTWVMLPPPADADPAALMDFVEVVVTT